MVDPMKAYGHQGHRNKFGCEQQEVVDSVTDVLETCIEPMAVEEPSQECPKKSKSFFAVMVSFTPYVIMGMGAYMIWNRARAMFKPPHQEEGHG